MRCLFVLCAALFSFRLCAANLFPDGGFENFTGDSSRLPPRWGVLTPFGTNGFTCFQRSVDVVHGGRASLYLKDANSGHFNHSLYYSFPKSELSALTGRVLRASAWIKQVSASNPTCLGIGLEVTGADGRKSVFNGPGVIGKTDWVNIQVKLAVPCDVRSARLYLRCAHGYNSTGEAYFDDIAVSADAADHPRLTLSNPLKTKHHSYALPDPEDSPQEAEFRKSWQEQPPVDEDGRSRPEIRNGTWYVNGHPEHYLGVWLYCSDKQWGPTANPLGIDHPAYTTPPGRELFKQFGFNSSQISAAPEWTGAVVRGFPLDTISKKKGGWRTEESDLSRFLKRFDDMPMVLDFAFGYHKRYPTDVRGLLKQSKAGAVWHAFVPFCPHHPEGRRYYRDYFRGGTRAAMRNGCNIFLYELFNESAWNDMCRYQLISFAHAMKKRYGRIEAANDVWRTLFDGFADVAAQSDLTQFPGVWRDWCEFTSQSYVELLRYGKKTVRSADRRSRVFFTEQASGTPPRQEGMDYRMIAAELDALAIEGGWRYGFNTVYNAANEMEAVVATSGSKHFYNCDFYQALSKGRKPVVNNEHYCTRLQDGKRVPSKRSDYKTSLWLELMHGVSSSFIYVWDKRFWAARTMEQARKNVEVPSYKSSSLLNPFNVAPEDLCAFREFRDELAPYQDRILPFPRTKPATVAVFFSKPTEIQRPHLPRYSSFLPKGHECGDIVADWYVTLLHALFPVKVVFEEDLDNLGSEVQALVFPGSQCNRPETLAAARRFMRRGGIVLASPGAFRYDEYLRPSPPATDIPRVSDGNAAVRCLLEKGVHRYAALESLENPDRPVSMADVQICDRGDFKFICLAAMGERAVRKARLRLFFRNDGGRYIVKDAVTGRIYSRASESSWDAEALANGINVDLPPQERVLLIIEQSAISDRRFCRSE